MVASWRVSAVDPAARLVALLEIIGHIGFDTRREPVYPFPEGRTPYSAETLYQAIEGEDEATAITQVRDGLDAGLGIFDHGQPEYIVSCHLVKVVAALEEELVVASEDVPWRP